MNKGKIWIFVALVLFLTTGFLAGIFFEREVLNPYYCSMEKPEFRNRRSGGPGRPGAQQRSHNLRLEKMTRALSLSDEQKEKVNIIFEKNKPEIDAFRDRMRDEILKIEAGVSSEIMEILDDDQKQKYAEFIKREKKNSRFGPHGKDRGKKHRKYEKSGKPATEDMK